MLKGELRVVPPGTQRTNNDGAYGPIIDCAFDSLLL